MVYRWSINMFSSVDANDVGHEFEKIEKEHGEITRAAVVEAARPKKSVMHGLFEWDDKIAGEKWREQQAGCIISALIVEKEENKDYGGRAYVNVVQKTDLTTKGRYVNYKNAMSDDEMRKIVLKNALRELISFKEKYKELNELSKIFEDIDYVQETLNLDGGAA